MSNNILILANHDLVVYNFRRELLEKLIENGNNVFVSCPYGMNTELLIDLGCKHINTKVNRRTLNFFGLLILFFKYIKILNDVNPSIVLTYTIKPTIIGGLVSKFKKKPYLVTITGLGKMYNNGDFLESITNFLYRKVLPDAFWVFFQNKSNLEKLINIGCLSNNYSLVPGSGVNLGSFPFLDYPKSKNLNFVFVGRIMKDKGIEEYLEISKRFKKKYDNIFFHVVGFIEETKYEKLINDLHSNGTIIYHGFLKDISRIILMSNALINPSHHEGLSNVLLEFSASGRPVIASKINGCIETFDEKKTGFGFEKSNFNDLEKVLEEFINLSYDDKKLMGYKAREKMVREFSRESIVKTYIEKIKEL